MSVYCSGSAASFWGKSLNSKKLYPRQRHKPLVFEQEGQKMLAPKMGHVDPR